MKVSYSLNLKCSDCGAAVNLAGEETRSDPYLAKKLGRKPERAKPKIQWRRDGKLIKTLNQARKFVLENPEVTGQWNLLQGYVWPKLPDGVDVFMASSVGVNTTITGKPYVKTIEFRFVDCPACGGRAYLGSGENASTVSS